MSWVRIPTRDDIYFFDILDFQFFKSYVFVRASTLQIDVVQLESNFLFLFQSRILRSQLTKNPGILEDVTSKPNMLPDMFALQQMKALQAAQNPAFKALVDARGK